MFLYSTNGILRCESIYQAELSDCFIVKHKAQKDMHPWDVLVMNIWRGKTNYYKSLYGRAMRHFDVRLCPIGAFGFYLLARFDETEEFSDAAATRLGDEAPDFTQNSTWFKYKLLVNGERVSLSEDKTEEINNDAYSKDIKKILKKKNIPEDHCAHLGRILGATTLQIKEVEDEGIRQIGNWQTTVRDLAYSTKLPLATMRKAAAYDLCGGAVFCPREQPQPEEELQRQIFPFLENAFDNVERARENAVEKSAGYLSTAIGFLSCLKRLRAIILQDAAAMMILHESERAMHPLFAKPVFQSELFQVRSFVLASTDPFYQYCTQQHLY